jgi:hypothetical protein
MQVESINDLSNGIALQDYVHTQFGKFTIAFKPTVSTKRANRVTIIRLTNICIIRILITCTSLKSLGDTRMR